MNTELTQYRVVPTNFWQALPMLGVDGYSAISLAEKRGWNVIASWGGDGYVTQAPMLLRADQEISSDCGERPAANGIYLDS